MTPTLLPMLATSAPPFDSAEHLFEIKWDGIRALAAAEGGGWRLWGRGGADYGARYPELAALGRLPPGTVVDGELVVLTDGRADLAALLRRHPPCRPDRVRHAAACAPVHYLLFDLLFDRGRSLLGEPLCRRRARLEELVRAAGEPRLVFSDGVVGAGRALFERAVAAGHEGVMAKHLSGRYRPGRRSSAWRKVKPVAVIPCAIVGYTRHGDGLHGLLVAAAEEGTLAYAAELTRGLPAGLRAGLARRLWAWRRPWPVVACPRRRHAVWVEPRLYCRVRFLCRTAHGRLRDAVFHGLIESDP